MSLVEVRSRRSCTAWVMQASAAAYVLSPDALGPRTPPARRTDLGQATCSPLAPGHPRSRRPCAKTPALCGTNASGAVDRHHEIRFGPRPSKTALHPRPRRRGGHSGARYHDVTSRTAVGRASSYWTTPPGAGRVRHTTHQVPGGDMTDDSRSIELEVEVPGTPEEIWVCQPAPASATGSCPPSTSARRPRLSTVRARRLDDGSGPGAYLGPAEPGRLRRERRRLKAWPSNGLIEARDHWHTCVVRLVNSGFGSGRGVERSVRRPGRSAGSVPAQPPGLHRRFPGRGGRGRATPGHGRRWSRLEAWAPSPGR